MARCVLYFSLETIKNKLIILSFGDNSPMAGGKLLWPLTWVRTGHPVGSDAAQSPARTDLLTCSHQHWGIVHFPNINIYQDVLSKQTETRRSVLVSDCPTKQAKRAQILKQTWLLTQERVQICLFPFYKLFKNMNPCWLTLKLPFPHTPRKVKPSARQLAGLCPVPPWLSSC